MATAGGALEPHLRCAEIERDAAAETIGLPKVELRIGIALSSKRLPDRDRRSIIGALPRFDSGFHGLSRCRNGKENGQGGN
jgi:hypothetical protein